jgi:hypothetical protein
MDTWIATLSLHTLHTCGRGQNSIFVKWLCGSDNNASAGHVRLGFLVSSIIVAYAGEKKVTAVHY